MRFGGKNMRNLAKIMIILISVFLIGTVFLQPVTTSNNNDVNIPVAVDNEDVDDDSIVFEHLNYNPLVGNPEDVSTEDVSTRGHTRETPDSVTILTQG